MIRRSILPIAFFTVFIPALDSQAAKGSVLIDFDPKSADQTVIVESIAVDHKNGLDGIGASIIKIEP